MSGIMLAMNLSGCSFFVKKDSGNTDIQSVRQESENADKTVMKRSKSEEKEAEEILEICSKTYAKAEKEGKLDDLEMIRDLIKELGEKGFTAVDSENQVNMTEYEKLIQFSEKAEAKKNGRMTVVEVAKGGSCIIRNMETHDGIVNMIRSYCIYENGKLKQSSEDIYRTESWEYTEDGHLMFSGRLAFEGSYEVTRNEIMEYMAYRVLSLDETCRELNRKYILPIGYERNNMFLTDWSEEEFAELDFYDMFDLFYQENHTANGEFTFGNAMGTSAVYLVNMTEYEKLIQFSEKAEAKKNGRMTVVEVAKGGSCIIRNMETHDGIVNMIRSYCIYENGKLKQSSEDIYRTESWEYTEDGHLMFSGRLAFEGSYEVTRNEIMEYMAYRVLSLDETCRELNRKYILPIGYERNNMFLTDWSEEEFAELDFYDMFDLFYQENHTANGEFTFGNAMGTSAVYLISKEKFEPVIKSKFKISSEVLQSKTVYYPCEEVYEYKPRGLEETEYPEYPYPEVIGYVNNDDGTLTLKVQAVFPYRGVSKAYIHEVTVRDTKDGGIQYVGNRIIEPINNPEIRWHVPRLTRTEWEELYGDN